MPRVALSMEQKKGYKLKDFKAWVTRQMKLNGKRKSWGFQQEECRRC
jgi:hypothetical protein